ncbi:MAG: hypothetical protein JNM61_05970 [Zoogloeaceae bacterium]|nr:hypothetical protein [Zoogloeaceae bacterium]
MGEFAGEARFVFHATSPHFLTRRWLRAAALATVTSLATGPAVALCVKAPEAKLRQGPGTRFPVTWEVFKFMPFQALGSQGRWQRVRDVDGDTHWIHRNLTSPKLRCAVVKSTTARVRSAPRRNAPTTALSPVKKYYAFQVLSQRKGWVEVRDEVGNKGWIAQQLLWVR